MKINFVSFLHPDKFHGGGELDNRMLINEGRKLGFDIKIASRLHNKYLDRFLYPKMNLHRKPDLWLLADLFNVPEYGLSYRDNFLETIIRNDPFVHIDNAYVDICSKIALPCSGNRQLCASGCGHRLTIELYNRSLVNVFLSPLHANTINGYFNNKLINKSFIVKPLINTAAFYNMNIHRDIDFMYVGTVSNYKGYQNIKERFSQEPNFLFIGENATGEKLFGQHIEHVENSKLIYYLNRAKRFVHLPSWKEPMGRTVVEAALCGCQIISNDNVGACSFNFDISNPVNCEQSAAEFWQKMRTITLN